MRHDDPYTKLMLTVIALCLLWLCVMTSGLPVQARQDAPFTTSGPVQAVAIVGWGTVDEKGRVTIARSEDRRTSSDPNIPVRVIGYPMPARPVDVRLGYTDTEPLPVGLKTVKRGADWDPIRVEVEPEPPRARPGR